MQVYIDANIFLGFYAFSQDAITELQKLIPKLADGSIFLLLPSQTLDEVNRNRDTKLSEATKDIFSTKLSVSLPHVVRGIDEGVILAESLKEASKNLQKLKIKINEMEIKKEFQADQLISSIFSNAINIDSSPYHSKALQRFQRGSPPGKKSKTIGDELNWESLLDKGEEQDISIISHDGDFYSSYDGEKINSSLATEWKDKKNSEAKCYRSLSKFFKALDIDIKISTDKRRKEIIESLRSSGNFAYTHSLIEQLEEFTEFEPSEISSLVRVLLENSQVGWILSDEDVFAFYGRLREKILNSPEISDEIKTNFEAEYKTAKDFIESDEA